MSWAEGMASAKALRWVQAWYDVETVRRPVWLLGRREMEVREAAKELRFQTRSDCHLSQRHQFSRERAGKGFVHGPTQCRTQRLHDCEER